MTSKGTVVAPPTSPIPECCMCGDYGLPYELFRCKVCLFRSQHRYCSNLYPKAESYRVCNWCLKKEGGKIEGTQNSPLSCSYKNMNEEEEDRKKKNGDKHVGVKVQRGTSQLHLINNPIKKQRSPDRSLGRKKINFSSGGGGGDHQREKYIRRTKSEEISNTGIITKQVFRGKVRRYKLLEEVF